MSPDTKHNIQCSVLFAVGVGIALSASLPALHTSSPFLLSVGWALAAIAVPQVRRPQ